MAKRKKKKDYKTVPLFLICVVLFGNFFFENYLPIEEHVSFTLENIPSYTKDQYVIINDNIPDFPADYLTESAFEIYGDLDRLGRCTSAVAKVGLETMPDEERGSIGMIKPSGWHTVKYDIVSGNYLYNRCHLIGYQLTGENANERNLITCTRQTNTGAMLDFENMVADYVKKTGNHVLYRSTPIFEGNNLVANGILLEGYSVEDEGAGIKFNVYLYNVQDGIEIDYATGESKLA